MAYTTVDEVAAQAAALGPGTLMAKVDIESAYRLIPVHPQDRILQGIRCEGAVYVDPTLPFGLRSAPKIFNAVADSLHWNLKQWGIEFLFHYLDDYILVAPPGCQAWLDLLLSECSCLGVPIAPHKMEGPTTHIKFLGILRDTLRVLLLPDDNLQRLRVQLGEWEVREACSRKELESWIGHLVHACKVIRSGRSFLHRMLDLLHTHNHTNPQINLSRGFKADLAWWQEFSMQWNGVSFLHPPLCCLHNTSTPMAQGPVAVERGMGRTGFNSHGAVTPATSP